MALTKCTECGQDISTEAPVCPHCGKPRVSIAPTPVVAVEEIIRCAVSIVSELTVTEYNIIPDPIFTVACPVEKPDP